MAYKCEILASKKSQEKKYEPQQSRPSTCFIDP